MNEENAESSGEPLDEIKRDADQELGELEDRGEDMEERLGEAESHAGDVDVPDPAAAGEPGVDETDVPEDEGESANEAGQ